MKRFYFFFLIFTFFLVSCSKNNIEPSGQKFSSTIYPASPTNGQSMYLSSDSTWDWENTSFIPFKGDNILLPWVSGANSVGIPMQIVNDMHKADGWVLLYNDFPYADANPFFVLYNKFTGIARVFMYITNNENTYTSFTWNFKLETDKGYKTAAFNLNRTVPEPFSTKFSSPSIYNIDDNLLMGVAPYSWYYSDIEFSYDPTLKNETFADIKFAINCIITNQYHVTLKENLMDNAGGFFALPASDDVSTAPEGFIKNFNTNRSGHLHLFSLQETDRWVSSYINQQTNPLVKSQIRNALDLAYKSIKPSNFLLNVFTNGLIYTSTNSPGKINLDIKAKIESKSDITESFSGPHAVLLLPGVKKSELAADQYVLTPNYNQLLGVFYIDKTPTIKYTQTFQKDGNEYLIDNKIEIDTNSFKVIINPAVREACSKIKISKQIVMTTSRYSTSVSGTLIDSRNNLLTYLGTSTMEYRYKDVRPLPLEDHFKIKLTLALTPKGKKTPYILIKEFNPQVQRKFYIQQKGQ